MDWKKAAEEKNKKAQDDRLIFQTKAQDLSERLGVFQMLEEIQVQLWEGVGDLNQSFRTENICIPPNDQHFREYTLYTVEEWIHICGVCVFTLEFEFLSYKKGYYIWELGESTWIPSTIVINYPLQNPRIEISMIYLDDLSNRFYVRINKDYYLFQSIQNGISFLSEMLLDVAVEYRSKSIRNLVVTEHKLIREKLKVDTDLIASNNEWKKSVIQEMERIEKKYGIK